MSQFVVFNGPGSSGAGSVLTLTGNNALAVSPTLAGNIDVVGSNLITVNGDPGTNTLTISQQNQFVATVTTVDATVTPLITFTFPNAGGGISANGIVVGVREDGTVGTAGAGGGFNYIARFQAGAGTATLVDASVTPQSQDSPTGAPGYQITISGQSVVLNVFGVAAQTWNWAAIINYVTV